MIPFTLIKIFLYLLILCFSSFGFGFTLLRLVRFPSDKIHEFIVFGQALGLGILGLLVFGLGVIQQLNPMAAWVLIGSGCFLLIIELIYHFNEHLTCIKSIRIGKFNWFSTILASLLVLNLIYSLFSNALVPPTGYDELAYHLAIPKIYIRHHSIVYIPYILQSNWPLNTEMLFTLSMLVANEHVARLMTWIGFILLAASLYLYGKKWFGTQAGWLASVLATSTPMALALAGTAMVEVPLALYTFLAVVCFIDWLEERHLASLLLSAFFSGIAAGIKLNGAQVGLIVGGAMLLITMIKMPGMAPKNIGRFLLFGALTFLVALPWYGKAWAQTGNPIWPFLYDIFGGRFWDEEAAMYLLSYIQSINMPQNAAHWILGFLFVTLDKGQFGSYSIGYSFLFLLPVTCAALIRDADLRHLRITRYLALLTLAFYTVWFFQTHQTRFMMTFIGLLALLSAAGLTWLFRALPGKWAIIPQLTIIGYLLFFSWVARPDFRNAFVQRLPYLTNQITRDQYLSAYVAGYPAFEYANQNLPQEAYILLSVWESRGYLLDREYMWTNPISQRAIRLDSYSKPAKLAADLRELGFTHVLINHENLYRFPYSKNEQVAEIVLSMLRNRAELIFSAPPIEIYRLRR